MFCIYNPRKKWQVMFSWCEDLIFLTNCIIVLKKFLKIGEVLEKNYICNRRVTKLHAQLYVLTLLLCRMDLWMNGFRWVDGWMDGWMDGWTDGRTDGLTMNGQMSRPQ
jgi:hypothetical protein